MQTNHFLLAANLFQRAAPGLDTDREHNKCRYCETRCAQRKHASRANRANNIADHNWPGYRTQAAKGRCHTRSSRPRSGWIKLRRVSIKAGPHSEHKELHYKTAAK